MQPLVSLLLPVIVMAGLVAGLPGNWAAADDQMIAVTIATTDGDTVTGLLEAIDASGIRIVTDSAVGVLPVASVRRIDRQEPAAAAVAGVMLIGTDGTRLSGSDVTWEGDTVRLETSAGVVSLPVGRVQTIDWLRANRPGGNDGEPLWRQSLPEELESDVVVVAKGDETQCVPCAILGITADTVRVMLDGETIPVKRDRVIGLEWLREPVAAGGIIVQVAGGMLPASRVEWSPEGLTIDDVVRFPPASLRSIDYAAARTTRLAGLTPERLDVEPFFGSLADIDKLADAFRPRVLADDADSLRRDLLIRARTAAVWRVPPGSRSFTTAISRGAAVGSGPLVVIAVDEREVFRGSSDDDSTTGGAGSGPVEVPLDGARRLSIIVDYGRAGPAGGVVILRDPLFTK